MQWRIRPISIDEHAAFHQTMSVPFSFDATPERLERFTALAEHERLRAAFDGNQMVATFGAFTLKLTVPGGTLPAAGTTVVTVLPTHRRRGILRSLMTDHLAEVHQRREPLAALWASESSIYGRFGYGPASERALMKLEKPFANLVEPAAIEGTMRLVNADEALRAFPPLYAQVAAVRPGMYARSEHWWRHRVLSDPESQRLGATEHRRVLHVRDGAAAGYALYRTKVVHTDGKHEVRLQELIAADPDAQKALWQYLFGIDLIAVIYYGNLPVDAPLRWWLHQPRRMERKIEDALWIRPVDAAAALAARRYSCPGQLQLRLSDTLCPWNDGVFRLSAGRDGTACCEPIDAAPEIELTADALGATYLGGHRFTDLARAGALKGSPAALRLADRMFAWDPLPWCQEVF